MRGVLKDWLTDRATDRISWLERLRDRTHPENPIQPFITKSIEQAYAFADELDKEPVND